MFALPASAPSFCLTVTQNTLARLREVLPFNVTLRVLETNKRFLKTSRSNHLTLDGIDALDDFFKARFSVYTRIRRLTSLKVVLDEPLDEDDQMYWLSTLCDALKCIAHVTMLEELELEVVGFYLEAYTFLGEVLRFTRFSLLERFTSLSIPHNALAPFLARQQSLVILNVGEAACEEECPLKLEDLDGLGSIRCSASCSASIAPGKPVYHARILDNARSSTDLNTFLTLFKSLRETTSELTRLDITFPSNEMEILSFVSSVAPQLVHLSLVEITVRKITTTLSLCYC